MFDLLCLLLHCYIHNGDASSKEFMESGEYITKNFTLYKDNDLVTYRRGKGLKWAGHVVRMFDNRIISYARRKSQRKKAC